MSMPLVVFGSIKGAPGVTTVGLATAGCWPAPCWPVLVEADPAGGDVASWFRLAPWPGLVELATASRDQRGGSMSEILAAHARRLPAPVGADVVVGSVGPAQESAVALWASAISSSSAGLSGGLGAGAGTVVLADVGRLDPASVAWPVVAAAEVVVLVVRPRLDGLAALAARLEQITGRVRFGRLRLVVCGQGPYRPADIASATGLTVAGVVGHDPAAAELLAGGPHRLSGVGRQRLARTGLGRAAAELASRLAVEVAPRQVTSGQVASGPAQPLPVQPAGRPAGAGAVTSAAAPYLGPPTTELAGQPVPGWPAASGAAVQNGWTPGRWSSGQAGAR